MNTFKKKLTAFTAVLAFLSISQAASYANTLSVGADNVLGKTGNVGITQQGNRTDVEITNGGAGAVGQVDWKDFNVGAKEQVNFGFSGLSQTIINRVLGGNPSEIMGKLTNSCVSGGDCASYAATSKVILINPAGVMFGAGSMVDLNSFTVSTFDIRGTKNIRDLSPEQLSKYQTDVLNKFSPVASVNGTGNSYANIQFDSNYQDNFKGIDFSKPEMRNKITMDGAKFGHFAADDWDGNFLESNPNNSLAFVADNISYKDSVIKTGTNDGYIGKGGRTSFSNAKLITADGVTFQYISNGYIQGQNIAEDSKSDVQRNITIDNSGLKNNEAAITSGDVDIENISNQKDSDINIKNTIIKGTKLVNREDGEIWIVGSNDVNIEHSRLETQNLQNIPGQEAFNTTDQRGGRIYVEAGGNLTVDDTAILSAASSNADANTTKQAGNVYLRSKGVTSLNDTQLVAQGNAEVLGTKEVKITNSLVDAENTVAREFKKDVTISGGDKVTIDNSTVHSSNDVNIKSIDSSKATRGNIEIKSTPDENGKNQTLVWAEGKLSIQGKNTTIDNAGIAYKDIKFYNDGTNGENNVTVKNNTTFTQATLTGYQENGDKNFAVGDDIQLETNGNFVLDNATLKRSTVKFQYQTKDNGGTKVLDDDGTKDGVKYSIAFNTQADARDVSVKSTAKNVTAKNNTNVNATRNAKYEAPNGNVTVEGSKLSAGETLDLIAHNNVTITSKDTSVDSEVSGKDVNITAGNDVTINAKANEGKKTVNATHDANITAQGGALHITDNAKLEAGNDLNMKSHDTIKFNAQGQADANIDNSVRAKAGNDMLVQSTAGNIESERSTTAPLEYGNRLTFNANQSNLFSSNDSLKSVNVDYVAGKENKFTTQGDIQFENSSFKAPKNTVNSGDDVILNGHTIYAMDEAQPENTITEVTAKGNITTKDVMNSYDSDVNADVHTFPQQVDYAKDTLDFSQPGSSELTLDLNNTKFKASTQAPRLSEGYNTDGSIDLEVKNAGNKKAGIELKAENVGGWDQASDKNQGPEVHVNAEDDQLAVSRIVTDKLTTDANDEMLSAEVQLTEQERQNLRNAGMSDEQIQGKGYIEVRDYMGYNQDEDFTKTQPDDFKYTQDFGPDKHRNPDGTDTDITKDHIVDFGQGTDGKGDEFILVYDRPGECPPPPAIDDNEPLSADSFIAQQHLPREVREISKNSRVSDNTVDQTSSIMSAAAKVDLAEQATATTDEEKDNMDDEE